MDPSKITFLHATNNWLPYSLFLNETCNFKSQDNYRNGFNWHIIRYIKKNRKKTSCSIQKSIFTKCDNTQNKQQIPRMLIIKKVFFNKYLDIYNNSINISF